MVNHMLLTHESQSFMFGTKKKKALNAFKRFQKIKIKPYKILRPSLLYGLLIVLDLPFLTVLWTCTQDILILSYQHFFIIILKFIKNSTLCIKSEIVFGY